MKLHQGKISLESKEGEGSRFIVELPADLKAETHEASLNRQTDDSSKQQSAANRQAVAPLGHQLGNHQFIDKSILVVELSDIPMLENVVLQLTEEVRVLCVIV